MSKKQPSYKVIMAQPAMRRFQWEVDTALTSIRAVTDAPVVLLFTEFDRSVVEHFKGRYDNVEVHSYQDRRENKSYPATTRPFLMHQYLKEDPARELDTYFQIDCDVIFREWPDLDDLDFSTPQLYGSDCGGYIDYEYLRTRTNGQAILNGFCRILSINEQLIKDTPGVGAQWIYNQPKAQMWWHIWKDCDFLYQFLEPIDSNIQKWTAEMWSQLYNFAKFGYGVTAISELDFCRPTDDIKMWEMTKLLHNAGVVGEGAAGLLYKGKYVTISPFDEDLSWVRRDKAGWWYKEAVDKAAGKK